MKKLRERSKRTVLRKLNQKLIKWFIYNLSRDGEKFVLIEDGSELKGLLFKKDDMDDEDDMDDDDFEEDENDIDDDMDID